jgi:hypothetical protein
LSLHPKSKEQDTGHFPHPDQFNPRHNGASAAAVSLMNTFSVSESLFAFKENQVLKVDDKERQHEQEMYCMHNYSIRSH